MIEDHGRLVFTNTPSRANARPVPGVSDAHPAAPRGLPETIYDAFIERVARENGLSPRLIKAVALVESAMNPHAVSSKGAQGLMQLMPETARQYGVVDAFDPLENIRAGARHLRSLLDEFGGDRRLALAAYNAGSGAVRRAGGVPDYPETRAYIRSVEARMEGVPDRTARRDPPPAEVRSRRLADGTVMLSN